MKKSLIVRWSIVAVVLLAWIWAMCPLQDSDYLAKFQELAGATQLKDERAIADWKELCARLSLLQHKKEYDAAAAIRQKLAKFSQEDFEAKRLEEDLKAAEAKCAAWLNTEEGREFVLRLPIALKKEALEKMEDPSSAEGVALSAEIAAAEKAWNVPRYKDAKEQAKYEAMVRRLDIILTGERNMSGFRMLEKAANGTSNLYRISLNQFIKLPFIRTASNKVILRALRVKSAGKLRLGLDLRGGTEFVLGFDSKEAKEMLVDRKACTAVALRILEKDEEVVSLLPAGFAEKCDAVVSGFRKQQADISLNDLAVLLAGHAELGEEIRQFVSAHVELLKSSGKSEKGEYGSIVEIRDRIINILDNRLNSMGVTEPEIKATGNSSISVRMPSVDEADKNEIRNTIRRAAKLQFFLVSKENDVLVKAYEADPQNFQTPVGLKRTELEVEREDGTVDYYPIFLEARPTAVKGEDVVRAGPTQDELGRFAVSLTFNGNGSAAFRTVTHENVNRRLAIVLDDKVYSAPNITEGIDGGQAQISGNFTREEAIRLGSVIASGNVPVSVVIDSEFGTDPTLGADSVHSGLVAGLIGLIVVVLFMLWYYRTSGFLAVLALGINSVLVLGTMAILKATITMPGIAGMVLTIGMAVDANVIIFERIREELRAGKTVTNALVSGYGKAFTSIFDSNLTTLITCFFLYRYGTGSIKGFAVTLSCGIVSSMFTAIFLTRTCFDSLNAAGWIKSLPMRSFRWLTNMRCEILKYRHFFVTVSILFVIASLVTFVVRGRNMLSIDFSGGTELAYVCDGGTPNVEEVRAFLENDEGYRNVRVGYKRGQSGDPLLEIILPVQGEKEKQIDFTQFSERLDRKFPEVKISLRQTNSVGGNVGSQFKKSALIAGLLSLLGVIIYLAFRFEPMYGLGAAIAVLHDGIVSAGLFIMMGGTLSLTVVAAVMTIIGYSLNDTIVIFDRVRETMEERVELSFYEKINLAICECMSRTILTSVTTMFSVVALLVVGGGAIRDFAWVMFFGVITGTYSTIFIACSFVNTWHRRTTREKFQRKG